MLPTSDREWTDVLLAPFKTYPILIFLIATVWSTEICGEPMILLILLGYLVCLIVVTSVAMAVVAKSATTYWHWSAATILLGFLFALKWLPTMAE